MAKKLPVEPVYMRRLREAVPPETFQRMVEGDWTIFETDLPKTLKKGRGAVR